MVATTLARWLSDAWSTYVLHTQHGLGYDWWSGPGSDLGQITLVGIAVTALGTLLGHVARARLAAACHEPDCTRVAIHHFHDPDTGEVYRVCGPHHPREHAVGEGHPLGRMHRLYHEVHGLGGDLP